MSIRFPNRPGIAVPMTAAQNAAQTLPAGRLVYGTDTKIVYVHDGSTAGGIPLDTELEVVATPSLTASAEFTTTKSVTITCATSGASIYYTTDGSTPTSESTLYEGAITVSSTTTVKAIGIKTGYDNSAVGSATYTKVYPVYYGKSASTSLDEAGVLALGSTNKTSAAGSYDFAATEGYSYLATRADWSTPTSILIGAVEVPLESSAPFDTAFGSLYCMLLSVGGVSYRVFRSTNSSSGAWTATVT